MVFFGWFGGWVDLGGVAGGWLGFRKKRVGLALRKGALWMSFGTKCQSAEKFWEMPELWEMARFWGFPLKDPRVL